MISGGNSDAHFQLESGVLKLQQTLDYEVTADRSFSLDVIAVDGGGTSRTGTITLSIVVTDDNDNAPSCTDSAVVLAVSEDVASGTVV